jgi:hypothetical protein
MLKIKLLNEQLTLNNFEYLEVKEYIPNLPLNVKIQIMDSETGQRLIPSTSAKLIAIFQKRDSTELTVNGAMIFNPDDRSMWTIPLTAVQSNDIIGSNVLIKLDFNGSSTLADLSDSTDLRAGMAYSILAKITFDGEC